MAKTKEDIQTEQRIEKWLAEINTTAQEMVKGSIDGLYTMIVLLDVAYPYNEPEPTVKIEELTKGEKLQELATFICARDLLERMWGNLGPGTLGFPSDLASQIQTISKPLGAFIQAGAFRRGVLLVNPLEHLGEALQAHQGLINIVNARAEVEDGSNWIQL